MPARLCGQDQSAEVVGVSAPLHPMIGGGIGSVTDCGSRIARTQTPVGGAQR